MREQPRQNLERYREIARAETEAEGDLSIVVGEARKGNVDNEKLKEVIIQKLIIMLSRARDPADTVRIASELGKLKGLHMRDDSKDDTQFEKWVKEAQQFKEEHIR